MKTWSNALAALVILVLLFGNAFAAINTSPSPSKNIFKLPPKPKAYVSIPKYLKYNYAPQVNDSVSKKPIVGASVNIKIKDSDESMPHFNDSETTDSNGIAGFIIPPDPNPKHQSSGNYSADITITAQKSGYYIFDVTYTFPDSVFLPSIIVLTKLPEYRKTPLLKK